MSRKQTATLAECHEAAARRGAKMNIRIGVHSFSSIADIEMADDVALTAIFDRLRWAERAEAFIRRCAKPNDELPIYEMVREEARELLNQLEKKDSDANNS